MGNADKAAQVLKPEYHRGVGERGIAAAAAVTRGAGEGPRTLRTDANQPSFLQPGDASPAGADTADVHRRKTGHVTEIGPADPGFLGARRTSLAEKADIEGGAARVNQNREGSVGPLLRKSPRRRYRPQRRPGTDLMDGRDAFRRQDRALGGAETEFAVETVRTQCVLQTVDVLADERLQGRIDTGRARVDTRVCRD